MGVWIETVPGSGVAPLVVSHPTWVCGLKLLRLTSFSRGFMVTPYVGVWIETLKFLMYSQSSSVTPYVGVWIETPRKSY